MLINYLEDKGYHLEYISSQNIVDEAISNHPDIFLCKMGISPDSPVFFAERNSLSCDYPLDVSFNAACTGKYFIHNLTYTNEDLLAQAKAMNLKLINVNQGYTKCSIVIVDENSIITYDEGIAKACQRESDLAVLKIAPGFVRLDGYDTGFIGGTSGRIDNEIVFNGNLSDHPDFKEIVKFIEARGLICKWFESYKLTDIGSIL